MESYSVYLSFVKMFYMIVNIVIFRVIKAIRLFI